MLRDWASIPAGDRFSSLIRVRTSSDIHPVTYGMAIGIAAGTFYLCLFGCDSFFVSVRVRVSADSLEERLLECVRIEIGLLSYITTNTATSTVTPLLLLYHYSLCLH